MEGDVYTANGTHVQGMGGDMYTALGETRTQHWGRHVHSMGAGIRQRRKHVHSMGAGRPLLCREGAMYKAWAGLQHGGTCIVLKVRWNALPRYPLYYLLSYLLVT